MTQTIEKTAPEGIRLTAENLACIAIDIGGTACFLCGREFLEQETRLAAGVAYNDYPAK